MTSWGVCRGAKNGIGALRMHFLLYFLPKARKDTTWSIPSVFQCPHVVPEVSIHSSSLLCEMKHSPSVQTVSKEARVL